jgi:hypothetical protein
MRPPTYLFLSSSITTNSEAQGAFSLQDTVESSVGYPDPEPDPDPHVFGPSESGSGSISQRYGSGSFSFLINVLKFNKKLVKKLNF